MRKDVKLGFAIGGVLLAVAIVFALVNSSRTKTNDEVVDDTTSQTDTTVADAGKTGANTAVDVKPDTHVAPTHTETGGAAADNTPTPKNDSTAQANAASDSHDVFGTTDWDKTLNTGEKALKTGTPILMSATDVKTPDVASSGVITRAPSGPVSTGAAGFNYVDHRQQGDADAAVTASANTLTTPVRPSLTSSDNPRTATTHLIKNGETFSTIAAAYYGNAKYHKLISAANPKVDPTHLKIGQVITLPAFDPKSEVKPAAPAAVEKPVDAKTQYRVQSGDNLHRICIKLYGDPKNVDVIYNLNKAAIGSDPAKLKLGMVLTLPAAPTVAVQ